MDNWDEFLTVVKAAGGSTDMQTSVTGRYPYLFHFCRGQSLNPVIIYAHCKNGKVISSPGRDWRTKESLVADYKALSEHGATFNDTEQALSG
jgi:hypothetical protein